MQNGISRNIVNLSGGKDSTALAVYLKQNPDILSKYNPENPEVEYVFCDTGKELKETYEYLNKVEVFLGQPIVRLNSEFSFDHWLAVNSGFLPSARMRWCTRLLKLKPFEKYIGEDLIYSFVAIRADENRDGYISKKPNIQTFYPFKDDGKVIDDVYQLLEDSGLGKPDYYVWRTRSGCYFCFFQRKSEWIGLKNNHPDLFQKAKEYEKEYEDGTRFTWQQNESLDELAQREPQIMEQKKKAEERIKKNNPNMTLMQVFENAHSEFEDTDQDACTMCEH
tara:strand:+ start:187 stop:1023 length:837 start_codon:yes stop_codon:yes gene_type:complete